MQPLEVSKQCFVLYAQLALSNRPAAKQVPATTASYLVG
jgi:hypothetical protein